MSWEGRRRKEERRERGKVRMEGRNESDGGREGERRMEVWKDGIRVRKRGRNQK